MMWNKHQPSGLPTVRRRILFACVSAVSSYTEIRRKEGKCSLSETISIFEIGRKRASFVCDVDLSPTRGKIFGSVNSINILKTDGDVHFKHANVYIEIKFEGQIVAELYADVQKNPRPNAVTAYFVYMK